MWKILGKKKPSKVPEQLVFPGKSRYEKDPIKDISRVIVVGWALGQEKTKKKEKKKCVKIVGESEVCCNKERVINVYTQSFECSGCSFYCYHYDCLWIFFLLPTVRNFRRD